MSLTNTLDESIRRFERYSESDPNNLSIMLQLADFYHRGGRFDDALNALDRCAAQHPTNVKVRSTTASVLISMHRFQQAHAILSQLVAGGDTDAALQHNLGLTLYFQRRFKEAREHFDLAEQRGLTAANNFAYLARTNHHLGDMKAAVSAAEKWTSASKNGESKGYLALLHYDDGDSKTACMLAYQVLADDPHNVDCNVVAGSVEIEHQNAERARERFNIALRHDQKNGRAWLGLGLVHLYDQEATEAVAALQNAARIFPDNAGIAVTLGWAHLVGNDPVTAEHAFSAALETDRNFSESHAGLAAARALLGKSDLAKESLALARRLDRHSIGADVAESFVSAAEGNGTAAADAFAAALKKSPGKDTLPLIEQLRLYSAKKHLRNIRKP